MLACRYKSANVCPNFADITMLVACVDMLACYAIALDVVALLVAGLLRWSLASHLGRSP